MIKYRILIFAFLSVLCISLSSQDIKGLETRLDSLVQMGMDSMAFPGAQLLVATGDSVLLFKSYGFHTYEKKIPVQNHHVYDLASVTKVTSGLLLLMKMVEAGLVDLDEPISSYHKAFCKKDKKKITLRQALAHHAGLEPYIVFWKNTLKDNGKFKKKTFKTQPSRNYDIKITDQLYLHKNYHKKMLKAIKKSEVVEEKERTYRYSGLFFLLLPELIEKVISSDYEAQLRLNIYDKMALQTIGYNPLDKFELSEIVPTESDTFFRKTLVHGRVHDEAAAMLDSKSCNAGLFSNAKDLATIFQMLIRNGLHNGVRVLDRGTIREFTSYQFPELDNRRGLGFDKPLLEYDADAAYIAKSASPSSFGHSGFTGTLVWADPEADLILVFLSNRVYPDRSHRKLYQLNIRPQIHQACYDFLGLKNENMLEFKAGH